jgi:hypothetical protein
MRKQVLLALFCVVCMVDRPAGAIQDAAQWPEWEQRIHSGRLADAETMLRQRLTESPADDKTRFALGITQFVRAVERLSQALYAHGLKNDLTGGMLPILRLPVPDNPNPRELSYERTREVLQAWINDLKGVRDTLAPVRDPDLKLPIAIGLARMDLDLDGECSDEEALWQVFARFFGMNMEEQNARDFVIALDAADAKWLEGYCNLLCAVAEMVLAHDYRELFERTGHIFFPKVASPHGYLASGPRPFAFGGSLDASDAVAFIHLMQFDVVEPQRMASAVEHLQAMTRLSRESFAMLAKETDNDREWIPNSSQESVLAGTRVSTEMVQGWMLFLDELDGILAGTKLIPFWRSNDGRGVNLRRAVLEQRKFDLVLWVQGSAATPYLEKGPVSGGDTWERIQRLFRGDFIGYAVWFN